VASGPQSFTDGLQQLASDAMRLATLPDADPIFCMKVAQAVVAKARMPAGPQKPTGAPGAPPPGAPGPGIGPQGMAGGPPGASPANPGMPTQGAPTMGPGPGGGPSMGLSPQNSGDEIRRMIQGATASG